MQLTNRTGYDQIATLLEPLRSTLIFFRTPLLLIRHLKDQSAALISCLAISNKSIVPLFIDSRKGESKVETLQQNLQNNYNSTDDYNH